MVNSITVINGNVIIVVEGKRVGSIPEAIVCDAMGIDPNVLPQWQRMVMAAKNIVEHAAEATVVDGVLTPISQKSLMLENMERARQWLLAEHQLRTKKVSK